MTKEIELTRLVYRKSWNDWAGEDCGWSTYAKWLKHEYKITLHEDMYSCFNHSITGDEKDVMFFLLRFS